MTTTVRSYTQYGRGFRIDGALTWHPVAVPEPFVPGRDASGFGMEIGDSFLAVYVAEGIGWVQVGTQRWPLQGAAVSLYRREDKNVFVVELRGQRCELEYRSPWHDIPLEAKIGEAFNEEDDWDLGRHIVSECSTPADVDSFVRYWS